MEDYIMKKLLAFLALFIGSLGAMNKNSNPRVFTEGSHRDGHPTFFTSFKNNDKRFIECFEQPAVMALPFLVPGIGHYQNDKTKASRKTVGDFYNWRAHLALIELSAEQLNRLMPESIKNSLRDTRIPLENIEGGINILGNFFNLHERPIEKGKEHSCNIAFHPIMCHWRNDGLKHFNEPINAGIFDGNGAIQMGGGITFNRLAHLPVNYHGALSPDNGRVRLDQNRGLITFWSVGIYRGRANVVFNIIANNEPIENTLLAITSVPTIEALIEVFRGENLRHMVNGDDEKVLQNILTLFDHLGYKHKREPVVSTHQAIPNRATSLKENDDLAEAIRRSQLEQKELAQEEENIRRALEISLQFDDKGEASSSYASTDYLEEAYELFVAAQQSIYQGRIEEAIQFLDLIENAPDYLIESIVNLKAIIDASLN